MSFTVNSWPIKRHLEQQNSHDVSCLIQANLVKFARLTFKNSLKSHVAHKSFGRCGGSSWNLQVFLQKSNSNQPKKDIGEIKKTRKVEEEVQKFSAKSVANQKLRDMLDDKGFTPNASSSAMVADGFGFSKASQIGVPCFWILEQHIT